jgi:hypothetical protein
MRTPTFSTSVFDRVARREISAARGAQLLAEADRQKRERKRPGWAPAWAWGAAVATVAFVLSLFGINVRQDA